jgi:isoamylase
MSWFDQHGEPISEEAWHNPEEGIIVLRRAGRNLDGAISALTLIMNPTVERMTFRLPAPHMPTRVLVDSDKPQLAEHDIDGHEIVVAGRSAVLVSGINQTMS